MDSTESNNRFSYVEPSHRWMEVYATWSESGESNEVFRFTRIEDFISWSDEVLIDTELAHPLIKIRNWAGGLLDVGVSETHWFVLVGFEGLPYCGFILRSCELDDGEAVHFCEIEECPPSELLPRDVALACIESWLLSGTFEVVPRHLIE